MNDAAPTEKPQAGPQLPPPAEGFSPREIVSELDRYIVGQGEAKRAVAIALRNRWRRQQLPEGLREEVQPKNILMIGPTGVGKTEIARRLARLAQAPFLKVEATKFTEVGYVGRDVEQIIRDLVAHRRRHLLPPPAVAQRDRHRPLGRLLPDDVAIQLLDDRPRRQILRALERCQRAGLAAVLVGRRVRHG